VWSHGAIAPADQRAALDQTQTPRQAALDGRDVGD
jgi:hypothetical protein